MSTGAVALIHPGEDWMLDDQAGFPGLIGPIWVRRQAEARYGLHVAAQHLNRDGALHGGVLTSLFDHALGFTAFAACNVSRLVTIQLDVHFISGGEVGDFLEFESEVVRQTGSYLFMRGHCYCGTNLLATSDGIWKKMRP